LKRFLLALAVLACIALPRGAHAAQMTAGDSVFTTGATFKIYPLFTLGGAHMHNMQWVTTDNGFLTASRGFIYSSTAALRVNVYRGVTTGSADRDTSGFTIPAGGSYTAMPDCDSIQVVVQGPTTVTWGLFR
jgi:hypothetical protein